MNVCAAGTSEGGYGSDSVSLPIILIKIKVNQMLNGNLENCSESRRNFYTVMCRKI